MVDFQYPNKYVACFALASHFEITLFWENNKGK